MDAGVVISDIKPVFPLRVVKQQSVSAKTSVLEFRAIWAETTCLMHCLLQFQLYISPRREPPERRSKTD